MDAFFNQVKNLPGWENEASEIRKVYRRRKKLNLIVLPTGELGITPTRNYSPKHTSVTKKLPLKIRSHLG